MNHSLPCVQLGSLALLVLPLMAAAQGLVRGPELPTPRQQADPPDVQVVRLPSGQQMKRLPGGTELGASPAPAAQRLPAAAVQQVGNVQVRLLSGAATSSASSAKGPDPVVRQVGKTQVLEMPGQPAPGQPAVTAVAAVTAKAGLAALPAGFVVVEVAAGQPVPTPPAANTFYRVKPAL